MAIKAVKKPKAANAAADQTILDPATGLEWTLTLGDSVTWETAKAMEKTCRVGGHKDWSLPTRKELLTLVDDTRINPAANVELFPDMKSYWYWAGTTGPSSVSDYAWHVSFHYGGSALFNQLGRAWVRLVRRARASQ